MLLKTSVMTEEREQGYGLKMLILRFEIVY